MLAVGALNCWAFRRGQITPLQLIWNRMAEEADSGVSSRVERKALQRARIVQRESERKILRLVRRVNLAFWSPASYMYWASGLKSPLLGAWAGCFCPEPQVRLALKKPESERSEEEAAVLALHRGTVEELCRRRDRSNVVKRKQEEVTLWAAKAG